MEFWRNLFSGEGFVARRVCGVWDDSLVALHVVSDGVIWMSYLWIPLVMLGSYFAHKNKIRLHGPILWILLLYVVFITACGWTHFFDALMFYHPVYRINGLLRALTAVVSLATAVSLVRLVPMAISAPLTILAQQAALHQQHVWLRDILDSATDGRLRLCEDRSELPRRLGERPVAVEVSAASDLRSVRKALQGVAETMGFDRPRINDLISAVHEASMNALVHADAATVHSYRNADEVQIWIEDKGAGIPLDKLPISTLKQGYSTAGTAGQGWSLILLCVNAAFLLTGPEGTVLVLEMHRESGQQSVPVSAAVGGDIMAAERGG